MTIIDKPKVNALHSPAPWSYDYSPYRIGNPSATEEAPVRELPAFEVFDADGEKVFDTNEDSPAERQEANARLASFFPELLAALRTFVEIGDLADQCADWRWEHLDAAFATARQLIHEVDP